MVRICLSLLLLTLLASAADAQSAPANAWVKLCDRGALTTKDKGGQEEKKEDLHNCMTHYERIDAESGLLAFSAALHDTKLDGKETKRFRVTVPLNMLLPVGMRATFVPRGSWERVAKDGKLQEGDKAKFKTLKLTYTHCHELGCLAEVDATPEIVTRLRVSGGVVVYAIAGSCVPDRWIWSTVTFPVPLAGFDEALTGSAGDTKKYAASRMEMKMRILELQQGSFLRYDRPTRCDTVVDYWGPCSPRSLLKPFKR